MKVTNQVIRYLLSTYYVPGAILRSGKQHSVKQRHLGTFVLWDMGTWFPFTHT